MTQVSGPVITWGPSLSNYLSSTNQLPTSQWTTSLPSTVVQGGVVYYRNSSGLLSSTPQQSPASGTSGSGGTSSSGGSPATSDGKTPISGPNGSVHYCLGMCF